MKIFGKDWTVDWYEVMDEDSNYFKAEKLAKACNKSVDDFLGQKRIQKFAEAMEFFIGEPAVREDGKRLHHEMFPWFINWLDPSLLDEYLEYQVKEYESLWEGPENLIPLPKSDETIIEGMLSKIHQKGKYFNASKLAKEFGKTPEQYLLLKETADYVKALGLPRSKAVKHKRGNIWLHQELTLDFCRWLDPVFHLALQEFSRKKLIEAEEPFPGDVAVFRFEI